MDKISILSASLARFFEDKETKLDFATYSMGEKVPDVTEKEFWLNVLNNPQKFVDTLYPNLEDNSTYCTTSYGEAPLPVLRYTRKENEDFLYQSICDYRDLNTKFSRLVDNLTDEQLEKFVYDYRDPEVEC